MMALRARPCPSASLDRENEGKAETLVVVGIQLLQRGEFLGAALVEAGLGLFAGRFGGQLAGDGCLAGQFRVGADQAQLLLAAGIGHDCLQRQFQRAGAGKRAARGGTLGDPRRMFVNAVQRFGECRGVAVIQVV